MKCGGVCSGGGHAGSWARIGNQEKELDKADVCVALADIDS